MANAFGASPIPADRLPASGGWTNLAGIPGGIPTTYWSPGTTNNVKSNGAVGDGVTDDTAALQAIFTAAAATGNVLIYFPTGTYKITGELLLSGPWGVVVRGDGPANTRIQSSGSSGSIITITSYSGVSSWKYLSASASVGDTSITVSDTTGYSVNDYVIIDEATIDTTTFPNVPGYMTAPCAQWVRITGISGNVVTFNYKLNFPYRTSYGARMSFPHHAASFSGIENLTVERTANSGGDNILLEHTVECWVTNVESDKARKWHIRIQEGANNEVRRCYIHDGWGGGGDSIYGVGLFQRAGNNLVEDNIFLHTRHALLSEWGGQNNVFGYNYSKDPINENGLTTDYMMEDLALHGGYPMFNLFEGNVCGKISYDYLLGGAIWNTAFRNQIQRKGLPSTYVACFALDIQKNCYSNNFVGCVYEAPPARFSGPLYRWGTRQDNATAPDTAVEPSSIVHGMRSLPDNSTTWNTNYSQTLPQSYYLAAKPSWYGTHVWPPIGPDVSGYTNVIPAMARYASGNYFGTGGSPGPAPIRPAGASNLRPNIPVGK